MAVLLIGSTGNGKSTFGNFILDPEDKHMFDKQSFTTARSNMPQTQDVTIGSALVIMNSKGHRQRGVPLTVIDTPGLNESAEHDLRHMIDVIKELQSVQEVKACVLVVKFSTKIDMQYKATVQYYSKLLPFLFERNIVIAMTDFACDERSVALRRRQRIDVDAVKSNAISEIQESGGLSYPPTLFTIDCLPVTEEERRFNLSVREAILAYIFSLEPISAGCLMVAKTAFLKEEDIQQIRELEGEITGYNQRLKQVNARAKEALNKMQKKEQEITSTTAQLDGLKIDLNDMDTTDTVIAQNWSWSEEWKLFRWQSQPFDVTSKWSVHGVKKWTNAHCEWKDYEEYSHGVRGKLEGKFMRGLYATIALETTKREKHQTEISDLKRQIRECEKLLKSLTEHRDEIRVKNKEHNDELQLLQKFICERRKEIKGLSGDVMSIEEALRRLDSIEH